MEELFHNLFNQALETDPEFFTQDSDLLHWEQAAQLAAPELPLEYSDAETAVYSRYGYLSFVKGYQTAVQLILAGTS